MLAPAALPRRTMVAIALVLGLLTVAAWLLTFVLMGSGMPAGTMGGPTAPAVAAVPLDAAMWVAMMAAMMLPSTAPVLAMVGQIARSRQRQGIRTATPAAFGVGYLLVWAVVGLVAAGIDLGGRAALGGNATLTAVAPIAAGLILALAGLYQLSPLKDRCLAHCRSPFGFLLTHWREGIGGAVVLGARHGLYCLGCCWALMVTLLVCGALGIVWPLTLALLIFLEKVVPGGRYAARAAAIGLVVLGLAQAAGLVMLSSPMGM